MLSEPVTVAATDSAAAVACGHISINIGTRMYACDASYELYKLGEHETRVVNYKVRVTRYELQVTSYCTSYE